MPWDTPSVNRARRPAAAPRAAAPVQRVSFGVILWRVLFALVAGAMCAGFAAWLIDMLAPRLGPTASRLCEAGAGLLGGLLAARALWRSGWTGRRADRDDSSGYVVAEAIAEVVVDIALD